MKFSKEAIDLSNISTEEKVRLSIQVSNKLKQKHLTLILVFSLGLY